MAHQTYLFTAAWTYLVGQPNDTPPPQPRLPTPAPTPALKPILKLPLRTNPMPPPPKSRPTSNPGNQHNTNQPVAGPSRPPPHLRSTKSIPQSRSTIPNGDSIPFSALHEKTRDQKSTKPNTVTESRGRRTTFDTGLPSPPLTSSGSGSRTPSRSSLTDENPIQGELDIEFQRLDVANRRNDGMRKARGRRHIFEHQVRCQLNNLDWPQS